jgi:RNA polymerase sigma factor (TIGR02999 family)
MVSWTFRIAFEQCRFYFCSMPGDVTRVLQALDKGDPKAAAELLTLVYQELRRLAASKMAHERPGQTLQPTALVHEAWLKLAGSGQQPWQNRRHFFAAAAEAMRRILIDRARRRNRTRHGHGLRRVDLSQVDVAAGASDEELLAVNEVVERLAQEFPDRARLVELRYFVGLSIPDAAAALGISESTAKRQWNYARLWLYRELKRTAGTSADRS